MRPISFHRNVLDEASSYGGMWQKRPDGTLGTSASTWPY